MKNRFKMLGQGVLAGDPEVPGSLFIYQLAKSLVSGV